MSQSFLEQVYTCMCVEELLDTTINSSIFSFVVLITPFTNEIFEDVYNIDDNVIMESIPDKLRQHLSFPITIKYIIKDDKKYVLDLVQHDSNIDTDWLQRSSYLIANMLGYHMFPMLLVDLTSPFYREDGEFKHESVINVIFNYFDNIVGDSEMWMYFIPDIISSRHTITEDKSFGPLFRARIVKQGE